MPSFRKTVVLDASALLAYAFNEPGGESIPLLLEDKSTRVVMSAVNWSEFIQKCVQKNVPIEGALEELTEHGLRVVSTDAQLAQDAALLWTPTKTAGLSLGDRMCLALGQSLNAQIWTSDKAWLTLKSPFKALVHCIR